MKLVLESFTSPGRFYEVDKDARTCDCPAFGTHGHCKHLDAVGCYKIRNGRLSIRPSFSQALSALVKSIRLRDLDEGAYWLRYCWQFQERLPGSQFRTARRLLIGSAEDGHSVAVMERLAANFPLLLGDAEFERAVAELIRICRVPNWWDPATGGDDYIYSGMLASRMMLYATESYSVNDCLSGLERAVDQQDRVMALFWTLLATDVGKGSAHHLAQGLYEIALQRRCPPAARLMKNVYLAHAKSLSADSNFTGQAAWILAGGSSPVIDQIETVTRGDVRLLIERVNDTRPHPPPEWCCDGIHCVGNDIRYAGMWDRMHAVCGQFNYYGRVDPNDQWLEETFYSLDGLRVRGGKPSGGRSADGERSANCHHAS